MVSKKNKKTKDKDKYKKNFIWNQMMMIPKHTLYSKTYFFFIT